MLAHVLWSLSLVSTIQCLAVPIEKHVVRRTPAESFMDTMLSKLPPSMLTAGASIASGKMPDMGAMFSGLVSSATGTDAKTIDAGVKAIVKREPEVPYPMTMQKRVARPATPAEERAARRAQRANGGAVAAAPAAGTAAPATKVAAGSGSVFGASAVVGGASDPNFSNPTPGAAIKPKVDAAFSEPDGQAPILPKAATASAAGAGPVTAKAPATTSASMPAAAEIPVQSTTLASTAQAAAPQSPVLAAGAVRPGDSTVRATGAIAGSVATVAIPAQDLKPITAAT